MYCCCVRVKLYLLSLDLLHCKFFWSYMVLRSSYELEGVQEKDCQLPNLCVQATRGKKR